MHSDTQTGMALGMYGCSVLAYVAQTLYTHAPESTQTRALDSAGNPSTRPGWRRAEALTESEADICIISMHIHHFLYLH